MPVACAVEMIQAYSLIHDDLPCMDDDAMRRGKPSCHVQFDEATALLAGDGLLTCSFETAVQSADYLPASRVLAVVKKLSECAGYQGMIGGQVIDLASEGKKIDEQALEEMYRLKTGALLEAACVSGLSLIHIFGELGNISFLRPNYAKAVADVVKDVYKRQEWNVHIIKEWKIRFN